MKKFVLFVTIIGDAASTQISAQLLSKESMSMTELAVAMNAYDSMPKASIREDGTIDFVNLQANGTYAVDFDEIEGTPIEASLRGIDFRKCDVCGSWVSPQDIRSGASIWDGNKRYCAKCLAEHQHQLEVEEARAPKVIELHGYHDSHGRVRVMNAEGENFELTDNALKGIGMELEVNGRNVFIRNNSFSCSDEFYALANPHSRKRVLFVEQDATVKAEIITNVLTEKFFGEFNWKPITDQMERMGNDEQCPDVGFHVHLSKAWLGDDEPTQVNNFCKLLKFIDAYKDDFMKLSKRDGNMDWCRIPDTNETDGFIAQRDRFGWNAFPNSHHYGLIPSGNTIEFRYFHSTNDPKRIHHIGMFLMGLMKGICAIPTSKCYALGKVLRFVPEETMKWLHDNGIFLHSKAANGGERGFSL